MRVRKLLSLAMFVGLAGLAMPASAYCKPEHPLCYTPPSRHAPGTADLSETLLDREIVAPAPAAALPERTPIDYGRDYGRLLILLAVPAAFVGLHLHLSRRGYIVPPLP